MGRKGRNSKPLTAQQERFAREYLIDLNATAAAERAGYSKRTAGAQGSRLLKNLNVAKFVEVAMAKRAERVEVKQDDVLRELLRVARADLRQAFNDDGSLKPIHEWPDDVAAFISSVEVDELFSGSGEDREQVGVTKKIKLWPKVQALELLGKHLKLWVDRLEHAGEATQIVRYEYPDNGRGPAKSG